MPGLNAQLAANHASGKCPINLIGKITYFGSAVNPLSGSFGRSSMHAPRPAGRCRMAARLLHRCSAESAPGATSRALGFVARGSGSLALSVGSLVEFPGSFVVRWVRSQTRRGVSCAIRAI